jgi:hypothetical protein
VIGITYLPEKPPDVRRFAKKIRTNYPFALGTEKTKVLLTESDVLPLTVVLDRRGEVREVIEGILLSEEFDEKIRPLLLEPSAVNSYRPIANAETRLVRFQKVDGFQDSIVPVIFDRSEWRENQPLSSDKVSFILFPQACSRSHVGNLEEDRIRTVFFTATDSRSG